MSQDTNDFDLFIGLVLAKLYEARGDRPSFSAYDFDLINVEDYEVKDAQRIDRFENTVNWLGREGYVRFRLASTGGEPVTVTVFHQMELTEKGFRALNSTPSALKDKGKPLGTQLVDAAKQIGMKGATRIAEKGADEGALRLIDHVQAWMS